MNTAAGSVSSDRASFLRPSITSTDIDVAATTKNRGRSGRLGDADDIDERKGGDPVWHKARRSLLKIHQHVSNEAEAIQIALPEEVQIELGDDRDIRHRLRALAALDRTAITDALVLLRLRLLDRPRNIRRDGSRRARQDHHLRTRIVGDCAEVDPRRTRPSPTRPRRQQQEAA